VNGGGERYASFVDQELKAERDRRETLDSRGQAIVTTSGALVALLGAVGAFVIDRSGFVLPTDAHYPLLATLGFFVVASFLGILGTFNFKYEVADRDTLAELAQAHLTDSDQLALTSTVGTNVTTIVTLRRGNNIKATLLLFALRTTRSFAESRRHGLFRSHDRVAAAGLAPLAAASAASVSVVRGLVSVLRGYLSAALLGVAAVVLLVAGTPAKAALAGAGFALFGAAITRGIDLAKEHRASAAQAEADRRRDLDETRRLAYALLSKSAFGPKEPMLVATLINALVHHGLRVDPAAAMKHVKRVDHDRADEAVLWLEGQIARITADLGS